MSGDEADLTARLRRVWREFAERGEPLPGEPALAVQLGASRPSLREALVRLEAEGLIVRRRGADTAVNTHALTMAARFDLQFEFAALLEAAGLEPSVHLLDWSWDRLDADQAATLDVPVGTPALRSVKRWDADGAPAMVAVDHVPVLVGDEGAAEGDGTDGTDGTGFPDLDRLGVGPADSLFAKVRPLTGDDVEWELAWPSAVSAPPDVAAWLDRPAGTALLTLDLVGVSRSGKRCYRALEHHVPGVVDYGLIRSVRTRAQPGPARSPGPAGSAPPAPRP
ncbi:MAG TPA: GntR family transcriptional regulator [Acidimicrobiales bacterium]